MDHIACLCLAAVIYNMDTSDNAIPRHQIYYVIEGECTIHKKEIQIIQDFQLYYNYANIFEDFCIFKS